jgi:hypothetical protein
MKILHFKAEQIKAIRVIEIHPNGESVTISGPNDAGKSTVLDVIERTFCGGDLPLRRGAEKGGVYIDLGEYKVTRTITEKSDRLVVKNRDGASFPSPQKLLSSIVGDRAISPLSFINKSDKEQIEFLFNLCPGLQEGLKTLESELEEIKQARSAALAVKNSMLEYLRANPEIPGTPVGEIDIAALNDKKAGIRDRLNAEYVKNRNENNRRREAFNEAVLRESKSNDAYNQEQDIAEKRLLDATELLERLSNIGYSGKEVAEWIATLPKKQPYKKGSSVDAPVFIDPELPDDSALIAVEKEIMDAMKINVDVQKMQERKACFSKLEMAESRFSEGLVAIKKNAEDKANLLSSGKIPIEGLSIIDGTVIYKDTPVRDLSTSMKIRVGSALSRAQNPEAEIILIDDASLLDSKSMEVLHESCAGMQLWTVINDETGSKGIYIEAGEIKQQSARSDEEDLPFRSE